MRFVRIKGGEFLMGSPEGDKDAATTEMPPHTLRISPFSLGVTEVTQAQYEGVVGNHPSYFSGTGAGRDKVGRSTAQYPVENVSWLEAARFCNALSEKDGFTPYYQISGEKIEIPDREGPGYRLPTEAEWEYACRAGKVTRFSFGKDESGVGDAGWYGGNSGGHPHPVAQKRPNDLGLYDMDGNVWEWCSDGWDADYYKKTPDDDPPGAVGAASRVFRGGGWDSEPRECRCANRSRFAPGNRSFFLGFRVARNQVDR
jgi:formylglycine-generating enzyme required for sulfatase activity